MILFSAKYLNHVLDNTILHLDNGKDVPLTSPVVTVYVKSSLDYNPYTRIICGSAAHEILRVVLATLDDGLPERIDSKHDLIGYCSLHGERANPRCTTDAEVTASIISNLIHLSTTHTSDVVHVDATQHAPVTEGFTVVVESIFINGHYCPQITVSYKEEILYEGDPGNIIMFSEE